MGKDQGGQRDDPQEDSHPLSLETDVRVIREHILKSGSRNHGFFGGRVTGGIRIQQHPDEFSQVVSILKGLREYRTVLEIGSAGGGSLAVLKMFLNNPECWLIDDNKHPDSKTRREIVSAIEFHGDSSSREARKWLESQSVKFDLIHIDGDHKRETVLSDLKMSLEFLSPAGVLVLHDTRDPNDLKSRQRRAFLKYGTYEARTVCEERDDLENVAQIDIRFGSSIFQRKF